MFLPILTNNLNWENLRILIFLRDGMGLKMKNFNIMWVHLKIFFFLGGGEGRGFLVIVLCYHLSS